ncbi:MAG: hypothetical protein AB1831_06500 [Pseudomonadota bacterium]
MPGYYLISEFEPHWHDEECADAEDLDEHDDEATAADVDEDSWVELEK